ncbi:MAG: hypothetical protein BJ554DRAFT_5906, partial [Olpidium bornovanus]
RDFPETAALGGRGGQEVSRVKHKRTTPAPPRTEGDAGPARSQITKYGAQNVPGVPTWDSSGRGSLRKVPREAPARPLNLPGLP